jgi:uncharacterized repeat protein (TIGR02543 family)
MISSLTLRLVHSVGRSGTVLIFGLVLVSLLLVAYTPAVAAQLTLTWTDAASNEDGFKIERATGTTGSYAQITTVAAGTTGYVDAPLTAGTTYCYRVRAYNAAGNSAYSNAACATPSNATLYTVTVTKAGAGSGTVASSPSAITCGSTCSASIASGTSIGLSATPAAGSTFTGWSGACTGTGGCALVVNANKSLTATFTLTTSPAYTLSLSKSGTGSGTVTATPAGISCGTDCTQSYTSGTAVTLTAAPAAGSTFTGWSGACSGTSATCTVSMTATRTVTATFASQSPLAVTSLTANKANPQPVGTVVTFTATAGGGTGPPYEYRWVHYNGSKWAVGREWSMSNTFTWTPTVAAKHSIQVWVRSASSTNTNPPTVWKGQYFLVTAGP